MDTSRLNPYFTIQKALSKKTIANDIYQNEWCEPHQRNGDADSEHAMNRAIRLYTRAAKEMAALLQGTYFQQVEKDHPQRHESQQILLDSLNNVVAVYLRRKAFHKAKLSAVEVLKIDPNNIKTLLRAAKACLLDPASTLEEASVAMRAAEAAIAGIGSSHGNVKNKSINEKELKRLKTKLKQKQIDYREKRKEMFGNKLSSKVASVSEIDAEAARTSTPTSTLYKKEESNNSLFSKEKMLFIGMHLVILFVAFYVSR